jgi:acyl dehydratase
MNSVLYEETKVGYQLPIFESPPVTRQALAIYCGASGDHNPVHIDIDFAKSAGLDDVIAHGMLIMAYAGRMITNWVPQSFIKDFETRFLGMTEVGDRIFISGAIRDKFIEGDQKILIIEFLAKDHDGLHKLSGSATLVFT